MTIFRKTNRSAKKSINTYARKYAFEHKDANGTKEKEEHFTSRRSVELASKNTTSMVKMRGATNPRNYIK